MKGVLEFLSDPPYTFWVFVTFAIVFFVAWRAQRILNPIFEAMINAVAINAGRYALVWLLAAGFGLAASLSAFIDIFLQLEKADAAKMAWWQILALIAKAIYPGLVAVLAFLNKTAANAGNAAGSPTAAAGTVPSAPGILESQLSKPPFSSQQTADSTKPSTS